MTSWSENDEKRLMWIYQYIKKTHTTIKLNPTWTKDNYLKYIDIKKLEPIIEATQWRDSTKKAAYFTISKFLQINDPNNKNIDYIKNLGYELKLKVEEADAENQLDEKEQENYRDQDFFMKILNDIEPSKLSKTEHFKYLLLALMVWQPTLRTNYYHTAIFIDSLAKVKDNNENYIFLDKEANKAAYIVQKDKVSNTTIYRIYSHLNNIEISDSKLKTLLFNSFQQYPRKYLFEINEHPVTSNTILNYLRSITRVDKINVDIMRSSYITNYYKNNLSYRSRDLLAKKMRHSVNTAIVSYNKILTIT